ncbi:folylpolyglutamate synthase, mitochondrial isoform X1 [Venturia canescens]|nr:folylpolyglutamate synthase, mitochondrial isoform X1 [Venturia canescens]XP_043275009.1 folylpolyglutamate synthase, mitochondrial isoform X1 [Venturia canescens]XP_043275010.1 folylpolyglutamate synthase, mitochondrial isoform X1 [Venturia canescens]
MVQVSGNGYASHAAGTYEDAIRALNSLQSNAAYLRNVKNHKPKTNNTLDLTKKYLKRSGISLEQLDGLSVIHVAGTKGKGSACAFTERILREHGFKTGLYTSPHLISVRERIRINGKPIEEDKFTKYFWKLYKVLESDRDHETDMPPYFKFLTLLMFHILMQEPVDVAIIEVGIGGEHDCTNIVRNPVCVGITSLGFDHTNLLGTTMQEIAYQKSGIFKSGTVAFSVPQPVEATGVLETRAVEKNCSLSFVEPLQKYTWPNGETPKLGILGDFQAYNASIAVSMARTWMNFNSMKKRLSFSFDTAASALSRCQWPGRTQILRGEKIDFYLDGAHTIESIECGAKWFAESIGASSGKRVLIFNTTGNRDFVKMLRILRSLNFDQVYFTPNVAGKLTIVDQINYNTPNEEQIKRCQQHQDFWGVSAICVESVTEALHNIRNEVPSPEGRIQVLVTGSLHLVGAALTILDPNLSMRTTL